MNRDVIIVGGGVIGCAAAFRLTRAGFAVALLEKGALAGGTTGASFGWANASTKTGDEAYHRLNAEGLAGHEALAAEFGAERLGLARTGALCAVARSDAAGFAAMEADFAALRRFGYPCARLDGAALRAETPGLRLPADAEALLLPAEMAIDAPRLARALAGIARAEGAEIMERRPAEALIADEEGAVEGVETPAGPVRAPRVILAAGAETGRLLARLTGYDGFAARFPLREVPGLLLTTPPLAQNPLRRILFGATTNELHLMPTAAGGVRMGSDDIDGAIWEDRGAAAMRRGGAALLARAAGVIPGLSGRVAPEDCALEIGVRPYPADGKPIFGPLPGAKGLFIVATHSGVTLAPALAARLPALLRGEPVPGLAEYGLGRFPGF